MMFNNTFNPWQSQLQNMQNQLQQLQAMTQQQQAPLPVMPVMQPTVQIQSVKGLDGAKAYGIPAQSSIILLDTDEPIFYMKMTDANGIETVKEYEFHERNSAKTEKDLSKTEKINSDNDKKIDEKCKHLEDIVRQSGYANTKRMDEIENRLNSIAANIEKLTNVTETKKVSAKEAKS